MHTAIAEWKTWEEYFGQCMDFEWFFSIAAIHLRFQIYIFGVNIWRFVTIVSILCKNDGID